MWIFSAVIFLSFCCSNRTGKFFGGIARMCVNNALSLCRGVYIPIVCENEEEDLAHLLWNR